MIDSAKAKAMGAGISNIIFSHAGFLTYEHLDQPAVTIATTFALHHLPDLWKGIALARMRSILKPRGQLYILDVIVEQGHGIENIKAFIDKPSVAETFSRTMRMAIFSKNIQPMTGSWTAFSLAQDLKW